MRKEIVYSLAALAGMPVMVNAAEVGVNTNVQVGKDVNLSVTLHGETELAKDLPLKKAEKMQLVFGHLNIPGDFTVTIEADYKTNGPIKKEVLTLADADSVAVDFVLTQDALVTITVKCEDPAGYIITNPFINLVYDFDAAASTLLQRLEPVVSTEATYISHDNNHYTSMHTHPNQLIDSISHADKPENAAIAYENVYKAFNLPGIADGTDSITPKIREYADYAKNLEVAALRDSLAKQQAVLNSLCGADGLDKTTGIGKQLQDSLNNISDSIDVFEGRPSMDDPLSEGYISSARIQQLLAETDVRNGALQEALLVKANFDVKMRYVNNLDTAMADVKGKVQNKFSTKVNSSTVNVNSLLNDELDDAQDMITTVKNAIKAAYKAGNLNDEEWNRAKGLKAQVDTIWTGTIDRTQSPADTVKYNGVTSNAPALTNGMPALNGILKKYGTLLQYSAFADSVGEESSSSKFADTLFTKVNKFGSTTDYISQNDTALAYLNKKYGPVLREMFPEPMTTKANKCKGDSIADTLACGVRDSVAALYTEIRKVAQRPTKGLDSIAAKYFKNLDDSVKGIDKAIAKYRDYKPYMAMWDRIEKLRDTLQLQKLGYKKLTDAIVNEADYDTVFTVTVGNHNASYSLRQKFGTSTIKGALTADSLRQAIDSLWSFAAKKNAADAKTYYGDGAGLFMTAATTTATQKTGYTKLLADIKDLGAKAKQIGLEWQKYQKRLFELEDTLGEVRATLSSQKIYTYSVKKGGVVYGNYKEKLDSILGKKNSKKDSVFNFILDEGAKTNTSWVSDPKPYFGHSIYALTDSLTRATGAVAAGSNAVLFDEFFGTGKKVSKGKNGNATPTVNDTIAIKAALDALVKNYKNDSIAYDSLAKEAMMDTLKASIRKMIASLHADSLAIFPENQDLQSQKNYGFAYAGLKEQVNAIMKELKDSVPEGAKDVNGALKWANKPNNEVNWDSIKVFADKLRPLVERMAIAKAGAVQAVKEKHINDSLMTEFGKDTLSIKNLLQKIYDKVVPATGAYNSWYVQAKGTEYPKDSLINVYKGDSAWFNAEYARLRAIYRKDSADLKADSTAGKLKANLTAWKTELANLKSQVTDFDNEVNGRYDNWKALMDLKKGLYMDVVTAYDKADSLLNKEFVESERADTAGYQSLPFYLEKLAYFNEKFLGKRDTDSIHDEGIRDKVFEEYMKGTLDDNKIPYMVQLVTLADSLNKLYLRATTNKNNFETLYGDSAAIQARINTLRDSLNNNYELADRQTLLNTLTAIEKDFQTVKPKELYTVGACEDLTEENAAYDAIRQRLNQLRLAMTTDYDAKVEATNNKYLADLKEKYEETRDLYEDVVKDQNDFMLVTNPALRDAVKKAAEKMGGFNDSLATYPAKINTAYSELRANIQDFVDKNPNKVYPRNQFEEDTTTTFVKYQGEMKALERDFIEKTWDEIDDTLDVLTQQNGYIDVDTLMAEAAKLNFWHFDEENNVTDSLEKLNARVITYFKQMDAAIKDSDIVALDLALNNFSKIDYPQSMDVLLEETAKADIQDGLKAAEDVIAAGNQYFSTVADDDPVKIAFEADKKKILGTFDKDGKKTADGVIQKIARILDPENDSTFVLNYGKGIDTTKVAEKRWNQYAAKGDAIADTLHNFIENNAFTAAGKNVKAYAALMANITDLENKLDSVIAKAEAEGYAVVEKMKNDGGAYNVLQQAIDTKKAEYEQLLTSTGAAKVIGHGDSVFYENTLRKIEDVVNELQSDSTTAADYVSDPLTANTLYQEEVAFITAKKADLLALFNQIAANANANQSEAERTAAKDRYEKAINDLYAEFDSLKNLKKDDPNHKDSKGNPVKIGAATPAQMLAIQNKLEILLDTLTAAAGEDGELAAAFAKQELTKKAEAIQEQAEAALDNAEDLTDEEAADYAAQLALIDADLDDIKDDVAADDNILFNKEKYGEQIKADSAAIKAIKDAAEAKSNENKKFNDFYASLDKALEGLRDSIEATKDHFGDFEKVTVSDFSAKFGLVDQRVAAIEDAIAENAALAAVDPDEAAQDTLALKSKVAADIARVKSDLRSILDEASLRDIKQRANALKKEAGDIKIDPNLFLASDYAELKEALDTINKMILVKTKDGFADSLGLITKANAAAEAGFYTRTGETGFSALKDSADNIEKAIAELKLNIELLSAAAEDDVRGDLTGDGEITREDLQMLIDIIKNQEEDDLDEDMFKRCDTNIDGVIDVTDIIWLQEMYMYGEWPTVADEAAASRSLFNSADKLNAQNMGTQNGITRMAINLDNNKAYQAFQMDFQLPEGAKVVEAKLGDRVMKTELMTSENGANYRVIAIGNSLSSIQGEKGAVLYLDIEGMNGELTGEATFVKKNFGSEHFSISATTAIDKVKNAAAAAGQTIYNLGGRMVDGLKKGVNILRGEDGSAKKVIKK